MTDPVKAKIQELVPEVMELKFGCEVRKTFIKSDFGHSEREYKQKGLYLRRDRDTLGRTIAIRVLFDGNKRPNDCDELDLEILGSPITLAVVLRAIGKNMTDIYKAPDAKIDTMYKWNLEHDNYDDQSQETKDFIGSLLTPHVSTSK